MCKWFYLCQHKEHPNHYSQQYYSTSLKPTSPLVTPTTHHHYCQHHFHQKHQHHHSPNPTQLGRGVPMGPQNPDPIQGLKCNWHSLPQTKECCNLLKNQNVTLSNKKKTLPYPRVMLGEHTLYNKYRAVPPPFHLVHILSKYKHHQYRKLHHLKRINEKYCMFFTSVFFCLFHQIQLKWKFH